MSHKQQKGFTLIELLVVISIIGVLSTIAMTSLNGARLKAKDAAIMSSVDSIMKAAQIDAVSSQDYSAYYFAIWPTGDCNAGFSSTSDPASVRATCNSIVKNIGSSTSYPIWFSTWGSPTYPKLSLMAWLPGAQKYYCVGSNGASSASQTSWSCGADWNCPGCAGDSTAKGN
ncbi:MAG: type II secretion system protein [Patescibacteria group bacterium]